MTKKRIDNIIMKTFESDYKELAKLKSGKIKISELKNYDSLKLLNFLIQIEKLLSKKITKKNFFTFMKYKKIISILNKKK